MKGYRAQLLFSLATRLASIALRLARNVLLARLLGPADRGLFALLNSLPDLIAAATSGGLNTTLGVQAAQQRSLGLLLGQLLVFGCLLACLATLGGIFLVRQFGLEFDVVRQLGLTLWLLVLATPLTVLKSGLLTLHNASGGVTAFNSLRLLESSLPLVLLLALWLVWRDQPLLAALISWLLSLALVALAGWAWLARRGAARPRWPADGTRELLSFSGRSHPDVLFQQLLLRADYLLIASLLGPSAVGQYAMATAAVELLLIVPEAVTTPLMKRLLQQGQGIETLTPLALRLTASVMLLACLALAVVGEALIHLLFGAAYLPAYPALLALLPGVFALCYASILRLDLLGKGRPGSLSLLLGLATLVNLGANLLLLPHLGIVGAGLASSLAYGLATLGMLALFCRLSATPWQQTLLLLPSDLHLLRQLWRERRTR
ncbi:polysaccharide biosynthesis protein [Pseudomonas oryzihabitans]|uniref:lipopolysaccharide biosynthesis protein n=1 Tax=Pseudomonas oryzihabitans TaxID=47885 RepID=UPI00165D30D8|nr:oligosaccharide flippase family protein [Pseudomonas psychrotolerans]QNQ99919.1 polysaccharide biosynthesis protein [Pseudomonas psychrotolerans]